MNDLEMLLAMQDDQFQKILQNDKILNDLEKEKNDAQSEYLQLISVLTKSYKICNISIQPLTPILWSFLYCVKNQFVIREKQPENIDIDVFIYLLHFGIKAIDETLFEKAKDFCKLNNINYLQAKYQILNVIYLAFRAFEMLPHKDEQPHYNLDWLTRIVSLAVKMCGKDSEYIAFNMSLTECLYYVIQACRQGDIHNTIRRRNSDEVNEEMYKRTLELGKKYYEENYLNK